MPSLAEFIIKAENFIKEAGKPLGFVPRSERPKNVITYPPGTTQAQIYATRAAEYLKSTSTSGSGPPTGEIAKMFSDPVLQKTYEWNLDPTDLGVKFRVRKQPTGEVLIGKAYLHERPGSSFSFANFARFLGLDKWVSPTTATEVTQLGRAPQFATEGAVVSQPMQFPTGGVAAQPTTEAPTPVQSFLQKLKLPFQSAVKVEGGVARIGMAPSSVPGQPFQQSPVAFVQEKREQAQPLTFAPQIRQQPQPLSFTPMIRQSPQPLTFTQQMRQQAQPTAFAASAKVNPMQSQAVRFEDGVAKIGRFV